MSAKGDQLTVMCLECWQHISEFHNFHNVILLAQLQLRQLEKQNAPDNVEENSSQCTDRIEMPSDPNAAEMELLNGERSDTFTSNSIDLADAEADNIAVQLMDGGHRTDPERTWDYENDDVTKAYDDNGLPPNVESIEVISSDDCSQSVASVSTCRESEEYEDPIGVFTGGEFSQSQQIQTTMDVQHDSAEGVSVPARPLSTVKRFKRTANEIDAIVAQWRPRLECPICHKSHPTLSWMIVHYCLSHPHDVFGISCCGRNITKPNGIADHALLHMDPDSFKCRPSASSLHCHIYKVHTPKRVTKTAYHLCGVCDKRFRKKIDLEEHAAVHTGEHPYKCLLCSHMILNRFALYRHFQKAHPQEWANRKVVPIARCIQTNVKGD